MTAALRLSALRGTLAVDDGAWPAPVAVYAEQHGTGAATPARREVSPVLNADAIRRSFPAQWAEYRRANFKTAYGVQKAFPGIDKRTASDWINGRRDPAASLVMAETPEERALFQ